MRCSRCWGVNRRCGAYSSLGSFARGEVADALGLRISRDGRLRCRCWRGEVDGRLMLTLSPELCREWDWAVGVESKRPSTPRRISSRSSAHREEVGSG